MSDTASNLIKIAAGGIIAAAVLMVATALSAMGWNDAFVSGWLLAAIMAVLGIYQLRRRVSVLPIGTVATWTTIHLFLGWLAVAIFFVHVGLKWPTGALESSLAALFLITAATGALGQWLNHYMPQRLTDLEEELIYERLPVFHRQLRETAENLVSIAAEGRQDSPLASHYMDHLHSWFAALRAHPFHLAAARRRWQHLERGVEALSRQLSDDEQKLVDELRALMRKKHDLELSYTYQWMLKLWLMVHVPAAFGMIVVMVVHAAATHAFAGF